METIYGVMRSRATRPWWLAHELGLAPRMVPVIQAARLAGRPAPAGMLSTQSPEFLALCPAGQIPVLEDGDLVLAESLAITLYLARKHGGPLAPRDAAEDGRMLHWAFYGATEVEPAAVGIMLVHGAGRAGTAAGRAEIAGFRARLERPLRVIDGHLAAEGQMVGRRFTVADINMAEILRYATSEPGLLDGYPALCAWLAACQARPAFRKMWAARLAEPE